jgi:hypothetical protein
MLLPRRPRPLAIDYVAEHFPRGTVANISSTLRVNWDDVIWAAITLGRPNLHDVFQHGDASYHEAIFRLSAVRMSLEQHGPNGRRLFRTDAFKQLDPTEKGALSYFLGMTACKVFAARLLNTPWLLHLDVYRDQIGAVLRSRSRPDLVGQSATTTRWRAFECKGRVSAPSLDDKTKAKNQARRLVGVGRASCDLHIASFAYFKSDRLTYYWRDPTPDRQELALPQPRDAWKYYYSPFVELLRRSGYQPGAEVHLVPLEGLDIQAGLHPGIAKQLFGGDWIGAHRVARELRSTFEEDGYELDGVAVRSGESWTRPFKPATP